MTLQPSGYKAAWAVLVEELVALRRRAGISQRELGRRIALPQSTIRRIENGERRVDFVELIIICTACGEAVDVFSAHFAKQLARRPRTARRK